MCYDNTAARHNLTVSAAGNITINGTADAGFKLDVNGTGRFGSRLTVLATSGGNGVDIVGRSGDSFGFLTFKNNANNAINGEIGISDAQNMLFYTGASVKLTIASSGAATFSSSVTATKTAKNTYGIQIAGAFYGAPRLQVYDLAADPNGYMGLGTDMSGAPYELSNYFPRTAGLGRWSVGSWAGDFGTGQYVSGYNEKLFITESAAGFNVALTVGSGGLAGRLSVRGTTNDSSAFSFEAANSSGNSLFLVRNDGNVGIGVNPATKFHVEGATVSYGQLRFLNTSSSGEASFNIGRTNQTLEQRWTIGQGVAGIGDSFGFYTGGSSRVNLQTNGNVLIGTTTDNGARLQVNGNISAGNISAVTNTIGTVDMGLSGGGYATLGYNIQYTSTANTYQFKVTDTSWMADFGNANLFRIRYAAGAAGNTISYSNLLTINTSGAATFLSSVTANGTMSLDNDGTYGSTYKTLGFTGNTNGFHRIFAGTADNLYISSATSRGIEFWTNGATSTKMIITSGGNIGVGTNNPTPHNGSNALIIQGGGGGRAIMELHDSSAGGKAVFQQVAGTTYVGSLAKGGGSGDLILLSNGTGTSAAESVYVKANGNVLIGTSTDSGAKLYVDGDIRTGVLDTGYVSGFWKLGRAVIGTQPSETHQIIVEINGALFTIGAAAL
jgi:hypothetical protein